MVISSIHHNFVVLLLQPCLTLAASNPRATNVTAVEIDTTDLLIPCWYPISVRSLSSPRISIQVPIKHLGNLWAFTAPSILLHHRLWTTRSSFSMADRRCPRCCPLILRQRSNPRMSPDLAWPLLWGAGHLPARRYSGHFMYRHCTLDQLVLYFAQLRLFWKRP